MQRTSDLRRHAPCHSRNASTLVIMLGLLSVLIGLMLAITYRVRNGIVNGATFQHTAQAYIMLESSKLIFLGKKADGSLGSSVTAGDELDLPAKGKPFGNSMGWFHFKTHATDWYDVIVAGGAGGAGGLKSTGTINSGDPVANSMETRYHYLVHYNGPSNPGPSPQGQEFFIYQQDIQDNTLYPW